MKRFDTFFNIILGVILFLALSALTVGAYQSFFGPQEGYITRKSYTPASYSNTGTPRYMPEQYILTIQSTDESGNKTHNFIYVDSITFHEVELKDFFSKKCMCVVER